MGLKLKFANRILKSKLHSVKRVKKVFNLDSAKTAGVLWEISQKDSFDKLVDEFKKYGVKVIGLCYFPSKKAVIPDEIQGVTRKETTWTEIPKSDFAENFIKQSFDILIDLTGQSYFPMIYVTALSNAAFKVGYSGSGQNFFDFNIEFQEQPETSQLTDQILYYLKRINKTTIE